MVKQVTGAFRTAPREALLHFTRMVPMRHYIEKLTYTSALRLYRLPRPSQLLRRLGQDWYVPGQGDLPMVVARSCALPGKRNQRPTALEALALKVPSSGPKVDLTVLAPWEVPNWVDRVSYMGVETPFVRKDWIRGLTAAGADPSTMFIHVAAATCNREAEELGVVGGQPRHTPVVVTQSRGTRGRQGRSSRNSMQTRLRSLERRKFWPVHTQMGWPPPLTIYIFNASSPAIQAVKNPRSIKAHSFALRFHKALTTFFLSHKRGRKTRRPLFSRRTTSTTLQLAVDHAFTGSYAKRFRPLDPPPSLRCPCGHPLRTPHHLIRDCRLFYLHRTGHKIITNGRTLSLKTLFSTTTQMAHRLLSFIADSRAAMRPPEIGRWINIPPEPD
jgi:hypothetical protein